MTFWLVEQRISLRNWPAIFRPLSCAAQLLCFINTDERF